MAFCSLEPESVQQGAAVVVVVVGAVVGHRNLEEEEEGPPDRPRSRLQGTQAVWRLVLSVLAATTSTRESLGGTYLKPGK